MKDNIQIYSQFIATLHFCFQKWAVCIVDQISSPSTLPVTSLWSSFSLSSLKMIGTFMQL